MMKLAPEDPGEDVQPEGEKNFEVGVTRLCVPLPSRDKHVVLRAVTDFYLRLKADGYTVTQIHTDQGGEYTSDVMKEWTRQRDILHSFTPGDSPQTNGRAEVAVNRSRTRSGALRWGEEPPLIDGLLQPDLSTRSIA